MAVAPEPEVGRGGADEVLRLLGRDQRAPRLPGRRIEAAAVAQLLADARPLSVRPDHDVRRDIDDAASCRETQALAAGLFLAALEGETLAERHAGEADGGAVEGGVEVRAQHHPEGCTVAARSERHLGVGPRLRPAPNGEARGRNSRLGERRPEAPAEQDVAGVGRELEARADLGRADTLFRHQNAVSAPAQRQGAGEAGDAAADDDDGGTVAAQVTRPWRRRSAGSPAGRSGPRASPSDSGRASSSRGR
jgi:hypothetical protein